MTTTSKGVRVLGDNGTAKITTDLRTGETLHTHRDGSVQRYPFPPLPDTHLTRWEVNVEDALLTAYAKTNTVMKVELPPRRIGERPVVYLDQNHWIAMSQSLLSGEAGPKADIYLRLAELAENGRIVLPISLARLAETMKKKVGHQRIELAEVMLTTSRGWQMANPMAILITELAAAYRAAQHQREFSPPHCEGVFSLDPHVYRASHLRQPSPFHLPILGNPENDAVDHILGVFSLIEGLTSGARLDPGEWKEAASWGRSAQEFSETPDPGKRRKMVLDFATNHVYTADMAIHAANLVGVDYRELGSWCEENKEWIMSTAPMASHLRWLIFCRQSTVQKKWDSHDVFDVLPHSAAAAYADVLIGENTTCDHLNRSSSPGLRPPMRARVFPSTALTKGLDAIETLLA